MSARQDRLAAAMQLYGAGVISRGDYLRGLANDPGMSPAFRAVAYEMLLDA